MSDPTDSTRTLIDDLAKREHYFRNAVEGEYDANLLQKARFAIDEAVDLITHQQKDIEALKGALQLIADRNGAWAEEARVALNGVRP